MSEKAPAVGRPQWSREEEADHALRHTAVRAGWACTLVLAFLAVIVAVPILQFIVEARRDGTRPPQPLEIFSLLPTAKSIRSVRTPGGLVSLLPKEEAIRRYEDDLENGSVLSEWALPRAQALLAKMGAGNEQAYCGVDGWLFYRPDVDYLTGRGFLDPGALKARARSGEGEAVRPDPVPAILQFRRQLAERGIELIVMPTPSKPMIQPEKLAAGFPPFARSRPLQNPSYRSFRDTLEREGIRIFDPSELLIENEQATRRDPYLQTDTHWAPEAMERAAEGLAEMIRREHLLPESEPVSYTRREETAENLGDVALMLKLPPGQKLYRPQQVPIHPVRTAEGAPWRPRKDADVLLLGDSYSNIYSLEGMGWGGGAGFEEQLSYNLKRPLDRIVINDGGSHTTRQQLQRDLARGRDRLKGKRLVVWQFAMRNLSEGDWKLLDFTKPVTPPAVHITERVP